MLKEEINFFFLKKNKHCSNKQFLMRRGIMEKYLSQPTK